MATYVAFLRGINVGGHRVQMAKLRQVVEDLGLGAVRSFIASGNLVFDGGRRSPATLERLIENGLEVALGYAVPTLLRTPAEILQVIDDVPFDAAQRQAAHSVHVIFLREAVDAETAAAMRALDTPRDLFRAGPREIYWWCGGPMSETLVPASAFARVLGRRVTTARNMTMLTKLSATL